MAVFLMKKGQEKLETMIGLDELKKSLENLGPVPDDKKIYAYAINYFNAVAKFQDNYKISDDMFKNSQEDSKKLRAYIRNSGRQTYGWVRAPKGQPVTSKNLYLGDVAGLFTLTADEYESDNDKYTQDAIQGQLRGLIKPGSENIISLIKKINTKTKKPTALFKFNFSNKQNLGK